MDLPIDKLKAIAYQLGNGWKCETREGKAQCIFNVELSLSIKWYKHWNKSNLSWYLYFMDNIDSYGYLAEPIGINHNKPSHIIANDLKRRLLNDEILKAAKEQLEKLNNRKSQHSACDDFKELLKTRYGCQDSGNFLHADKFSVKVYGGNTVEWVKLEGISFEQVILMIEQYNLK